MNATVSVHGLLSGDVNASEVLGARYTDRVTARLRAANPDLGPEQISARITEATRFLALCVRYPARTLSPSPDVDMAWHEMLLFTAEYQQLCRRLGVDFVHHEPAVGSEVANFSVGATIDLMQRERVAYDRDLWDAAAVADCACARGVEA